MSFDSNPEQRFIKRRYCFIWTRILLSATLTLTLSAFTIIYTIQQDYLERIRRGDEVRDMDKIRKQSIYDKYLNDISRHLLLRSNGSAEKTKMHIRAKTLNALLHVDSIQKTEILLFLYENYLIRSNYLEFAIDLNTADLIGCQFKRPCNLDNLYLPGVLADSLVFNGCQLRHAVFNGSSMIGAKFIHSHASGSHFDGVNLTNGIFIQTNNLKINFANAILVRSSFVDGPYPQKVNFLNADLLDSDMTEKQLTLARNSDVNSLLNTRLPNGSFSDIDTSQLIMDGGAELSCSRQNQQVFWKTLATYPSVNFINASMLDNKLQPIEGDCYFQCILNNSERYQSFSVRSFSTFIDSGQALFNLSAYFSCPFLLSSAYVSIGFYTEELLYSGSRPLLIKSEANSSFHLKDLQGQVPKNTHIICISVGANYLSSNVTDLYCLVDNISLNIFKMYR